MLQYIKLFEEFKQVIDNEGDEDEELILDEMDEDEEEEDNGDEEGIHNEYMDEETPDSNDKSGVSEPSMSKKNLVGQRSKGGRDNLSYMPQTNYP